VIQSSFYSAIWTYLNGVHSQGLFQSSLANNTSPSDFDLYKITDLAGGYKGVLKPLIANNKADAIIILWKNHPDFCCGGYALQPYSTSAVGPFTSGVDNAAAFVYGSKDFSIFCMLTRKDPAGWKGQAFW
jgi:hypothetical protein